MKTRSLEVERVGQIQKADVTLGDLTVFVGPQATGKSIFLQFLKLVEDTGYIHDQLRKHGIDWKGEIERFLSVYLGEGMQNVWRETESRIKVNGESVGIEELAIRRARSRKAAVFYIPAQRVLTLANGWPRPFQGFTSGDPFTARDFSENFRLLMEEEFSGALYLFPKTRRLKEEYRNLLSRHAFGGFALVVDRNRTQKRLVLQKQEDSIGFLAWSAGQREFVPLLMDLYWLMTSAKVQRRGDTQCVIIEEPEMGLHPNAISVVLLLVFELLWRGYRVCISTHSPHVSDVVWALRVIKEHRADPTKLLELFDVRKSDPMKKVAQKAIQKHVRVYYFNQQGLVADISNLDPGSDRAEEAGWGGLTEFSGRVNDFIASIVANSQRNPSGSYDPI
jgi:hypothetical protein